MRRDKYVCLNYGTCFFLFRQGSTQSHSGTDLKKKELGVFNLYNRKLANTKRPRLYNAEKQKYTLTKKSGKPIRRPFFFSLGAQMVKFGGVYESPNY